MASGPEGSDICEHFAMQLDALCSRTGQEQSSLYSLDRVAHGHAYISAKTTTKLTKHTRIIC
jgi:hypothetical protein